MRIVTDYKHAQKIIVEQDAEIARLRKALRFSCESARNELYDCGLNAANARIEKLEAVLEAAVKLKDDMVMRADIGTYDGDHSVQAGATVWYVFCEALAAAQEGDSENNRSDSENEE